MNAGQLAALIAAVFFAAAACAAVYALLKVARLATVATRHLTGLQERTDALIEQARASIDRTSEQLTRTEAITASVDEVTASMTELTGQVSALAGLGRTLAAGPVAKTARVAYGVRHAVALRRAQGARGGKRVVPAAQAVPDPRSAGRPGAAPLAPASGQ